jgi:hypothetical protein
VTLKLHLGVVDVPYSYRAKNRRGRPAKGASTVTTGDVADILEAKYDVMATFFEKHEEEITEAIEKSLAHSLESTLSGAPSGRDPFLASYGKIETAFRKFLDNKEMDGVPGVPTEASLKGVSHRFKHPYAKRASRPSFIDTGLYEANFKAWIE